MPAAPGRGGEDGNLEYVLLGRQAQT